MSPNWLIFPYLHFFLCQVDAFSALLQTGLSDVSHQTTYLPALLTYIQTPPPPSLRRARASASARCDPSFVRLRFD